MGAVRGRQTARSSPTPVQVATDATDPTVVRPKPAPGSRSGFGVASADEGRAGTDRKQALLNGILFAVDLKVRPLR